MPKKTTIKNDQVNISISPGEPRDQLAAALLVIVDYFGKRFHMTNQDIIGALETIKLDVPAHAVSEAVVDPPSDFGTN